MFQFSQGSVQQMMKTATNDIYECDIHANKKRLKLVSLVIGHCLILSDPFIHPISGKSLTDIDSAPFQIYTGIPLHLRLIPLLNKKK